MKLKLENADHNAFWGARQPDRIVGHRHGRGSPTGFIIRKNRNQESLRPPRTSGMRFFLLIVLLFMLAPHALANSWRDVVAQVNQEIQATRRDVETTQKMIQDERNRLKKELSSLKEEVERGENTFQESKARFEEMLENEERLRKELEAEEAEIQTLEQVLRTSAKDVMEIIGSSLITPENPSRQALLAPLLETARFPGMDDIENLVNILFEEMEAGGEIRKQNGTFVTAQGQEVSGTLLRVGKFTAVYQLGDEIGYLRFDRTLQKMAAIPGRPGWTIRRAIEEYISGESDHLPLDLTGGVIAEQADQNHRIQEWLEAGGILVWPILLIAVLAMLLSVERMICLGRIPTKTDRIMDRLSRLALAGNWQACRELCGKHRKIPAYNVLNTGLDYCGAARDILENALEEAVLKELPRLERFLSTLSVLAAIAPLIGLLGTVTGMIHTFQGITVFGTSDPRMMSAGISEALITTQGGLAVAIPVMLAHHFFDRRVEKIVADMEEKGTSFITLILRSRHQNS